MRWRVQFAVAAETPPTSVVQATASRGSSRFIMFSSVRLDKASLPVIPAQPLRGAEQPLKRLHTFVWAGVPEYP